MVNNHTKYFSKATFNRSLFLWPFLRLSAFLMVGLVCFPSLAIKHDNAIIRYERLTESKDTVGAWETIEIGLELHSAIGIPVERFVNRLKGEKLNPFDPSDVDIQVEIKHISGIVRKTTAFYYQEFQRQKRQENWRLAANRSGFKWRIRGNARYEGAHQVILHVKIRGQAWQDQVIDSFYCQPSSNHGYLFRPQLDHSEPAYFERIDDNQKVFLIGENLGWFFTPSNELEPTYQEVLIRHMEKLAEHGGNFIRLGMPHWGLGFEWEHLNDYSNRLSHAWELDQVFAKAEELGIYIQLVVDWSADFKKGEYWPVNPYCHHLNDVKEPLDFFRSADARKAYQNKLRYIQSRWGYSTKLAVYELMNEVEGLATDYHENQETRTLVHDWFLEMKEFMRFHIGERAVTMSMQRHQTRDIKNKLPAISDLVVIHNYSNRLDRNAKKRFLQIRAFRKNRITGKKAIMHQEVGLDFRHGAAECAQKVSHRNDLWASTFTGACGAAMTWYWDHHSPAHFENYNGLSTFMELVDLENFSQPGLIRSRHMEVYFMNDILGYHSAGWWHSFSDHWYKAVDTSQCAVEKLKGKEILKPEDLEKTGTSVARGRSAFKLKGLRRWQHFHLYWYSTEDGRQLGDVVIKSSVLGQIKVSPEELNWPQNSVAFRLHYIIPGKYVNF